MYVYVGTHWNKVVGGQMENREQEIEKKQKRDSGETRT